MRLKQELVESLSSVGRLYEVGGAVRDSLISGQPQSKDIDFLVTGIPYRRLCSILRRFGRVDIVGRTFGVIKFSQPPNGTRPAAIFDFVLPRKEFSTGVGHRDFEVDFDHNLGVADDLARRDFTINAIAREVTTGEYVNPLNGRADIEAKRIRFTSPASFTEDPLRMLRAVQFAARFEFTVEPETLAAITANASMIATVSPERIAEELNKLLTRAEKPSLGFKLMQQTEMLAEVLPELVATIGVEQPGPYHAYPVFEHTLYTIDAAPPRLLLRMAALWHDIAKPQTKRETEDGATFYGHEAVGARLARSALQRLRYSGRFIDEVSLLVEKHMFTTEVTDKGLRRLIRKLGEDLIFDLLDLRRADVVGQGMGGSTDDVDELQHRIIAEIERKPPFGLHDLAINGNQIMAELNLEEGKLVGEILDHLLEMVLDDPNKNEYEILLNEVKAYLHREANGR